MKSSGPQSFYAVQKTHALAKQLFEHRWVDEAREAYGVILDFLQENSLKTTIYWKMDMLYGLSQRFWEQDRLIWPGEGEKNANLMMKTARVLVQGKNQDADQLENGIDWEIKEALRREVSEQKDKIFQYLAIGLLRLTAPHSPIEQVRKFLDPRSNGKRRNKQRRDTLQILMREKATEAHDTTFLGRPIAQNRSMAYYKWG